MSGMTLIWTGIVLLTVVAVAYGGAFLLSVTTGGVPTNELQRSFFRAGHAHAGVLIILGLLIRLYVQQPVVPDWAVQLSNFVLYAAILMPAGFFLSVIGKDPTQPNRLYALIWLGAASLTLGLIGAGVGLIVGGASAS